MADPDCRIGRFLHLPRDFADTPLGGGQVIVGLT